MLLEEIEPFLLDFNTNQYLKMLSNEFCLDSPFIVLTCGEKDLGKSTLIRYFVNRALDKKCDNEKIFYFDCDIGQAEFTMSGCFSFVEIKQPIFGPPSSHVRTQLDGDRVLYYGYVSPQNAPVRYLEYVDHVKKLCIKKNNTSLNERQLIFVNSMGWCQGISIDFS